MSDRDLVIKAVQQMPQSASFDEILDALRLLESVQAGLAESERGEGVSQEQVKELLDQWIAKSSGRRAA